MYCETCTATNQFRSVATRWLTSMQLRTTFLKLSSKKHKKNFQLPKHQSPNNNPNRSHDGDVRAVAPHLRRGVRVVAEPDHITPRLHLRHLHHVEHRPRLPHAVWAARVGEGGVAPGVHGGVVAARAVGASGFGTGLALARGAVAWMGLGFRVRVRV